MGLLIKANATSLNPTGLLSIADTDLNLNLLIDSGIFEMRFFLDIVYIHFRYIITVRPSQGLYLYI